MSPDHPLNHSILGIFGGEHVADELEELGVGSNALGLQTTYQNNYPLDSCKEVRERMLGNFRRVLRNSGLVTPITVFSLSGLAARAVCNTRQSSS